MLTKKILDSVKSYVETSFLDDDSFDDTLLLSINGYLSVIHQLSDIYYTYVDKETTYGDILVGTTETFNSMVQQYLAIRVRLDFDPPTNSSLGILEKTKNELEERIIIEGRK